MPRSRLGRQAALSAAGLLLLGAASPAASEPASAAPEAVIEVGMNRDYPPYEFVDDQGRPQGFSVEVLRAVADAVGLRLEFRPGAFMDVKQALRSGEIDVLCSMLNSPERDTWVDFATPLLQVEYAIFVRRGTRGIGAVDDLAGRGVLVERGTLPHEFLIRHGQGEWVVPVASTREALARLEAGEYEAAIVPHRQAIAEAELGGFDSVEPSGPPVASIGLGFAVREGDGSLLAELERGLEAVRSDGTFQQLYNRYFGVERRPAPPAPRAALKGWPALAAACLLLLGAAGAPLWRARRRARRRRLQPAAGRRLGRYELIERLGAGGMGEVWRARHLELSRPAAVKLVRVEALMGDDESREHASIRFEREARATAALRSPHTIELYDFGQSEDGSPYYAMELLQGLDLQKLVERFGPLPPARVVHLVVQACASLEEAHEQGLLHRDIKPANLFVCRLGTLYDVVKLLDFGLVKLRSQAGAGGAKLTSTQVVTGTPTFLSPEMIMGEGEPDPRSDLYSLGCVAWWLLTGRTVFQADSPVSMAVAHASEDPQPASAFAPGGVPPELDALLLACLAKSPDERPASARELAERLAACDVGEPWSAEAAAAWWAEHLPEACGSVAEAPAPPAAEAR